MLTCMHSWRATYVVGVLGDRILKVYIAIKVVPVQRMSPAILEISLDKFHLLLYKQ